MTLDIGNVANKTLNVVKNNFAMFTKLSLLMVGIPALMVSPLQVAPESITSFLMGSIVGVGYILYFLSTYLLQGAIVHASIMDLNGGKSSMRESFSIGLSNMLPLIGIAIWMSFGIMFGLILLIVPGFIFMTMWVVAIPCQVVEKTGVSQSFSRSSELTKGMRWRVFALMIVYSIIGAIIGAIGSLPIYALASSTIGLIIAGIIYSFVSVISVMIGAVGVTVLYFELRTIKEGIGTDALAAAFD